MLLRISLICFTVVIYIITFAFCKVASIDKYRDYDFNQDLYDSHDEKII